MKPISRLLLLLSLWLIGITQATAAEASAASRENICGQQPTQERSDRLWAVQPRLGDDTAHIDTNGSSRIQTPRTEPYSPTHGTKPPRPLAKIADYSKFNPYNTIADGWQRRTLHATHPHALCRYYVYGLRHILR